MEKWNKKRTSGLNLVCFSLTITIVTALFFAAGATAISGNGKVESATITAPSQQFEVSRAPQLTGGLVIRVTDSFNPIFNAHVYSTLEPENQSQLSRYADQNGTVTFVDILAGHYTFTVDESGFDSESRAVTVTANDTLAKEVWSFHTPTTYGASGNGSSPLSEALVMVIAIILVVAIAAIGKILREYGAGELLLTDTSAESDTEQAEGAQEEVGTRREPASSESLRNVCSHCGVGMLGPGSPYCSNCRARYLTFDEPVVTGGRQKKAMESPRDVCSYCGVSMLRPGATFCWNCGASFPTSDEPAVAGGKQRKALKITGKCMVCNLDVDSDEAVLWCPHCGNMAHKTHMLEWLHVKDYCPTCLRHLEESDLREEPVKRRGRKPSSPKRQR